MHSASLPNQSIFAEADMDKQDGAGMTALAIAARQGDLITLRILLKRGAHYNLCDKKGRSPLYLGKPVIDEFLASNVLH